MWLVAAFLTLTVALGIYAGIERAPQPQPLAFSEFL